MCIDKVRIVGMLDIVADAAVNRVIVRDRDLEVAILASYRQTVDCGRRRWLSL